MLLECLAFRTVHPPSSVIYHDPSIMCVIHQPAAFHHRSDFNRMLLSLQVLSKLGYSRVTVVDHGETVTVADGRMTVTAFEGAMLRLQHPAPD